MAPRPAISSMSLGRCYAGHTLEHKLAMAAKHGFEGIELFFEDLTDIALSGSREDLLSAAQYVRTLCTSLDLAILCLQPFWQYDGLMDRQRHAERIEEMKVWIELAHVLDTDVIQIPSSFLPEEEVSGDHELIISDLREVCDLGAQETPVIRFAYESLCWATHVDKWEQCWDIVKRVDRQNMGVCLDSFNILGRIYADPASETGLTANAQQVANESIRRLVEEIKPYKEKVFFIQIVDAERLSSPLRPGHSFYNKDQRARMSWSRNCRLFYGETERGAYLPVKDVAKALLKDIGYEGWVSMELFNRDMERKDNGVVEELAERGMTSWWKLVDDLNLDVPRRAQKSIRVRRGTNASIEQIARL